MTHASELTPALAATHARLSAANLEYLEFILAHPLGRARESYAATNGLSPLHQFPQQPFPTFVSETVRADLAAVSGTLFSLIKSLPERRFGLDPQRILDFYPPGRRALPINARLHVEAFLARPSCDQMIARPDLLLDESGFQMLELNAAGFLGGWESRMMAARAREVPITQEFFATKSLAPRHTDSLGLFLRHFAESSAKCVRSGSTVRVAVVADVVLNRDNAIVAESMRGLLGPEFAQTVAALWPDRTGEFFVTTAEQLAVDEGAVTLDGVPVHGLLDMRNLGYYTREMVECYRQGNVTFFNGLGGRIVTDKRNLALVSEDADEGRLSKEETRVVRDHLPFTRLVKAGHSTDSGGAKIDLLEYALAHRDELVLKDAHGYGGDVVTIGRSCSPTEWSEALDRALDRGDWIVQRRVDAVPFLYQVGENGVALHSVVWGEFLLGDSAGGLFLRMMPLDQGEIINSSRGATEGVVFIVDE